MELATVGLRTLLPKLVHLKYEYNLHEGARKDIHLLSKELEFILYVISEGGEVPLEQLSELVRLWARDVREVSYDAEDIVDTFIVRVQLGPERPSQSSARGFTKARREITKEIKGIKERLREVAEKRDRYKKIDYIASTDNHTRLDPRVATLFTNVDEIVGIEEAKEEVIKMLTEEYGGEQIRIVSIAGSGGLGKTTLAKVVYDEIRRDFDCTAFVSVSRNPDQKKLLKDILYKLNNDKFGDDYHTAALNEWQLIELVREFLHIKRYLIVIDDIWDITPWKIIRIALIENNMRSMIITTTRNIDVAEQVGSCYRLKPLSSESSEILFYRRIFGSKDKCPVQILEVSKKILKKCGGVPIAIITTACLLATKSEDIKVWNDVCDSIGSGLRRNPGMDVMRKILLLSYYDLPSHLKICLLYLSIFPEHYEIPKNQLIWRWVAEGFVQRDKQDRISFFGIGESYFNQLLNRSLIEPADMDMGGTPLACRVHDTVRDLIVSLSGEESFITTVLGDRKHSLDRNQVRWLSLHINTTWPAMDMPKLRSLTIFESDSMFEPDGVVTNPTPYLPHYHLLRVLDLREFKLKNLASLGFLGSLSHLRYLGLSTNSVYEYDRNNPDQLPVEIGKLQFLQTLDVSQTGVEELPSSIVKVRRLICLRGSDAEVTRLPQGLKKLTSLEVLERVVVTTERIAKELGHLTQLRVLDVSTRSLNKDRVEDKHDHLRACDKALVESIGKLKEIESLRVGHSPFDSGCCLDGSMEEPLGNLRRLHIHTISAVPTWIKPELLPLLSYLDIKVDYERREDIQVLGMLPCLRYLRFVANCLKEEPMERCKLGPDAFPCVVSCEFRTNRRGGLVPSVFPPGAMPMLKDFTLRFWLEDFCGGGGRALYTVDDLGLGHLPSLRSVNVYGFFHLSDNKAIVNDKVITSMKMKKKLRQEAAVHPNHPLRLDVDVVPVASGSA